MPGRQDQSGQTGRLTRQSGGVASKSVSVAHSSVRRAFLTGTSVAKTALIRFAEGLAAETQARGISVFAIHPGAVRTDMIAAYLQAPGSPQWLPALHQAAEDFWAPPEAAGALCVRLAAGLYDPLSGRFLAITDNLDDLLARLEEIEKRELYVLRLQT